MLRNPEVISCTVKSVGQRRVGIEEEEEGWTEGSRLGSLVGGRELWWRLRLTRGMVPDGTKPQSVEPALDALGVLLLTALSGEAAAALIGVASEPPAMGIQGCATRPLGDIIALEEMISGFGCVVAAGGAGAR